MSEDEFKTERDRRTGSEREALMAPVDFMIPFELETTASPLTVTSCSAPPKYLMREVDVT
jgi:hypothetical protein